MDQRRASRWRRVDRGLIFANLVDFDTQYGHRNDVDGLRGATSSGSTRGSRRCCRACETTTCWSSPPITATIRRRRAPITRASTCRCSSPAPRVRAGVDLGTRADVRRPRPDAGRAVRRRPRCAHGTSFLQEIADIERDSPSHGHAITVRFMTIREQLEAREREILAPQAAKSADSRGRLRPEPEDDVRPAFQRDRDRIIHCKAFRRLKHKTQVFFAPTGDHYRTRLTHTLEVSQIARTIAKVLRLHEELTEAIALGHDLGHTPFGHAGERVIDALMPGGFNHYEQSLRIVDVLENDGRGLNLTWEVRDGIAKHSKGKSGAPVGMAAGAAREHDRRADHARRRPHRLRQPRHRRCDRAPGCCRPEDLPRDLVGALGASSSARIGDAGQGCGHRDAGRRPHRDPDERRRSSRRCSACAASCSTRSTRTRSRPPSSRRRPDILSGLWEKVRERPDEFLDRAHDRERRARRRRPRLPRRHDRSLRRPAVRAALSSPSPGPSTRSGSRIG